ncbi:DUF5677 domain-containing protein [Paraburkholderia nemoris]|uniref:DUF5677 domain-containing protein n=1 Tax=Paraburkholderia nemoris TaxID=2793076 RepID=UPI0038BD30DE
MGSFEEEGFTGKNAAELNVQQRATYPDLFALADECTRLALAMTTLLPIARANRQVVVSQFYARAATQYQASMVLAQTGMTLESLATSRGLLETVFVMLAIAHDAVTPGELLSHDDEMRKRHANTLLSKARAYPSVEPHLDQLGAFVEQRAESKEISMHDFARRGKAPAVYDGLYRFLSNQALHPSVTAVDDYLTRDDDGKLYVHYRPLLEKTPAAVLTACEGILLACYACKTAKIHPPATLSSIEALFEKCQKLNQQYSPWAKRA